MCKVLEHLSEHLHLARLFMELVNESIEHDLLLQRCRQWCVMIPVLGFLIGNNDIIRALHHEERIVELFSILLDILNRFYQVDNASDAYER